MSALLGTRVTDTNLRLRMFLIFFGGMIALASVLFWKEQAVISAEYVDFPPAKHLRPSMDIDNQ